MKSYVGHLQFNINPQNMGFYKDLFTFLGWALWCDEPGMLGVGCEQGSSLWFSGNAKAVSNDYDGPGMNHLAIGVDVQSEIDDVVAYLKAHNVPTLFNTPCHRPDFSASPDKTYYQVMFESPDRILLEVVYMGPLAK